MLVEIRNNRLYKRTSCPKYIKKELIAVNIAQHNPRFLSFNSFPTKNIIGIEKIEGNIDDHLKDISESEKSNIQIFK